MYVGAAISHDHRMCWPRPMNAMRMCSKLFDKAVAERTRKSVLVVSYMVKKFPIYKRI